MPERLPTRIDISPNDDLSDVLQRLREAGGKAVYLEIPSGSPLFLTANEFRALRTTADQENIDLTLDTDDHLRRQLATMLHLAVSESEAQTDTMSSGRTQSQSSASASAPKSDSKTRQHRSLRLNLGDHGGTGLLAPVKRRRTLIIGGSVIAVVVVFVLIAIFFLLPVTTISLTLTAHPLTADVVYNVAPQNGAPIDGADYIVIAQPIETDVTFTETIKTTGTRKIPDKTASGVVSLSNPNPEEMTIPEGTILTSFADVHFLTTESVKIPAGNPAENTFGSAKIHVEAQQPGETGNLAMGDLSGRLESGVYFSNREQALSGGSDRSVATVSAADLETLQAHAESAIPELAITTTQPQLAAGEALLGPSITHGDISYTFDHQEGEDADELSVKASAHVTALKYNATIAQDQARKTAEAKLATEVPSDLVLAPSTVVLGEPELITEAQQSIQFRIEAQAQAVTLITDIEKQQLARDIRGKTDTAVRQQLMEVPGVQDVSIAYRPGWWTHRAPRLATQITILLKP